MEYRGSNIRHVYLANHWHTLPAETLFITSKLKLGLFKQCFNILIVLDSPKMGFVCNVEEKQPVPKLEQVIIYLYFIFNIVVIIYFSMQLFCIRSSNMCRCGQSCIDIINISTYLVFYRNSFSLVQCGFIDYVLIQVNRIYKTFKRLKPRLSKTSLLFSQIYFSSVSVVLHYVLYVLARVIKFRYMLCMKSQNRNCICIVNNKNLTLYRAYFYIFFFFEKSSVLSQGFLFKPPNDCKEMLRFVIFDLTVKWLQY